MRIAVAVSLLIGSAALQAASLSTLIGTGKPGFDEKSVNNPYGLTLGPDGALYFCDIDNHAVRRIDLKTKAVSTVAGTGKKGNSGDGGLATAAELGQPYEVRFDRAGNLFVVDMPNHVVRRVDRKTKVITTVAGTGAAGFSGDGGPANKAELNNPHSIAFDGQGRLLVCDIGNNRVRRIDLDKGTIDTWLGNGEKGATPEGGPLQGTPFNGPRAIDADGRGNFYLVLREGNAVFKIDPKANRVTRAAGTGEKGLSGDGGPALDAKLNGPKGISFGRDGSYFLADTENHAIRRVDGKSGAITTVAGTGKRGDGPEGEGATHCAMNRPHGVLVGKGGVVYIADSEAHRIRVLR